MPDPYPTIARWMVPASAIETTVAAVRPGARRGVESGVFWIGRRSEVAIVEAVVVPRGPGVEEHADQWKVGAEVYGIISRWAVPRGLSLLGWVHTHGGGVPARLSPADRTRSIQAPGVLAVVIGSGGRDEGPARWGWYVYDDDRYQLLEDEELRARVESVSDLSSETWRASLDGIEKGLG